MRLIGPPAKGKMNVRLFSISIVPLFLLAAATSRVCAADPHNVDKRAAGAKSDAAEFSYHPGETPEPASAAQKELADSLVAALQSKDTSRLRALIAPQSLSCFDKGRQPYLDDWFRRQFKVPIGKDYQVTVAKLPPDMYEKSTRVKFPLVPTHTLMISHDGAGGRRIYRRLIGQQDNRWRLI